MPDTVEPPKALVTVVVPLFNAMKFLPHTAPTILAAARRTRGVQVVFVDNGSTDESGRYLAPLAGDDVKVVRFERRSIGAARNFGAMQGDGIYLSFIDADCTIESDYFDSAITELRRTGAAATGCEVKVPPDAPWIVSTWHALHYVGRDRDVHYLNSANFFVTRAAFDQIGGFREDLTTGEDAEIGQRLVASGFRIRECTRVGATHLGNPTSLHDFYRRALWHGLGMFGTVSARRLDKPTAMMLLHLASSTLGLIAIVLASGTLLLRVGLALALQFVAPALTVAHRIRQTRRSSPVGQALILYWLYYWSRLHALIFIASGRVASHRK